MSCSRFGALVAKALGLVAATALVALGSIAVVPSAAAVAGYSISGHVYIGSSARSAVADEVSVEVMLIGTYSWSPDVNTDSAGNYAFGGLQSGNYVVHFVYRGSDPFSSQYWENQPVLNYEHYVTIGTSNVSGKDITLPAKATISGVVSLGSPGTPAAGAWVQWSQSDGFGNWSSATSDAVNADAGGAYSLLLEPGNYRLRFSSAGDTHQTRYWSTVVDGYEEIITLGTTNLAGRNITLPAYGTISGHVALGTGSVAAGAGTVEVGLCYQDGNTCFPVTTQTDSSGNYSFAHQRNGPYQLTIRHLASQYQPTTAAVTISSAALNPVANAVLLAARTISGHVALGTEGASAGAGEVRVSAGTWSTLTDSSGNYVLSGITDGSYRVRFEYLGAGNYVGEWWPHAPIADVAPYVYVGAAGVVKDAQLPVAASISGRVTKTGGAPVQGVTVIAQYLELAGPNESPGAYHRPEVQATTNANGEYSFPRLTPNDDYRIQFFYAPIGQQSYNQWWGGTALNPWGDTFALDSGEAMTGVDPVLAAGGSVSGYASCVPCGTPAFNQASGGSWLEAYDAANDEWVPVQSDGLGKPNAYFSFNVQYPGTYRVGATYDAADNSWGSGYSEPFEIAGANVTTTLVMTQPDSFRIGGQGRFDVSASISELGFDPGVPVVYIANGLNFPDALSAAPAASLQGGPLLLVSPTEIPAPIAAEIARLQPAKIVVVGGPASVSPAVFTRLEAMAPDILRIGGLGRYEVSRGVAEYAWGGPSGPGATVAYITTGRNFPDALSAGGAAALQSAPVIAVDGDAQQVDAETRQLLIDLGVSTVKIAGGPGSVSPGMMASIDAIPGIDVVRLWGLGRYEASGAINRDAFINTDVVFLAVGTNYPDALSGGALAGAFGSPIYVIPKDCIPSYVVEDIRDFGASAVIVLGGPGSVGESVLDFAECA